MELGRLTYESESSTLRLLVSTQLEAIIQRKKEEVSEIKNMAEDNKL